MRFLRTVRAALLALRRNVMRTGLTCLGIIIGIAAVIAIVEIGNGSSTLMQKTIEGMGVNTIMVMPGTAASGGVSFGAGTTMTLTPQDCDAIARECPAVAAAAPIVHTRTQVVYGSRNWVPNQMNGTTPAYLGIQNWNDLAEGECFTDQDVRNAAKVCVIGRTLVDQLFGDEDPIGKEIRLQNVSFKVVGVLRKKGANMVGMDQDDVLLAPWTTIKNRVSGASLTNTNQSAAAASSSTSTAVNSLSNLYPGQSGTLYPTQSEIQAADTPQPIRFANIDLILGQATSAAEIPTAISQITRLLHERHHIHAGDPDDFNARDMTEFIKAFSTMTSIVSLLLLSVATISLIVGGVGIMNIMLVSVTERTREIGLRMAVGARGRDILRQFLIEAVVLCLIGGAIGILIGRGFSLLVRLVMHWPTRASIPAILAAVIVSAMVGIIFGFYPAWKASKLDPIEALRYE